MSVQVYGCNHLAIEVDDVKAAVKFYEDVFNLKKLESGEGDAFFQLGEHQFLATAWPDMAAFLATNGLA